MRRPEWSFGDHDLAEALPRLVVFVRLHGLRERENAIDHRMQAMESDSATHGFELRSTTNEEPSDRDVSREDARIQMLPKREAVRGADPVEMIRQHPCYDSMNW